MSFVLISISEQRERELKVLTKKIKVGKQDDRHPENKDSKTLSSSDKKTVENKKLAKDKKKFVVKSSSAKKKVKEEEIPSEMPISSAKKKVKEEISFEKGTLNKKKIKEEEKTSDKSGTASFKRNLRPRRSSTMLDDYIMTDSEEDYEHCESKVELKPVAPKPPPLPPKLMSGDSKTLKSKNIAEESGKKNLKINKTDLKPKKDLNKIDSEVKKSLSETKSKSILKRDKELEINNKTTAIAVVDKKSSKNKTETVITKETKTAVVEGSKKKVPPLPNKQQQQQCGKKSDSAVKKVKNSCNMDLYNNNKKQLPSPITTSTSSSPSCSVLSGITSQTKEQLLERMAANFDADTPHNDKETTVKKVQSSMALEVEKSEAITTAVGTASDDVPTVNNSNKSLLDKKEVEATFVSKIENVVDVVTKTENVVSASMVGHKIENVDQVEKIECLAVQTPVNKMEKMENIVFKTITKDLLGLDQDKEIKITLPEYFSSKNFQLPKFKQDDGLSVLSEICSALPRFNEPFVPLQQTKPPNKPMISSGESGFVKYSTVVAVADPVDEDVSRKEADPKPLSIAPLLSSSTLSFESRAVKIVQLARNNNGTTQSDGKRDLAASWRRAFKNVKIPKNGLPSITSSGSNTNAVWATNNWNRPKKTVADSTTSGPVVVDDNYDDGNVTKTMLSNLPQPESLTDSDKKTEFEKKAAAAASLYLAKTTATKYDLKFEKRSSGCAVEKPRKDGDVSSSDDLSPEKKIFHQRRLSTTQTCSGNSSDAFSPDNETSVYAFQPDLPVASTPFRRNKPQSPAKSRTVSPNTSIAVSILMSIYTLNNMYIVGL